MKRLSYGLLAALMLLALNACCNRSYETVENDPLNARIYTLDNGLKVYMTVNKNEPRIQTYIAVRAGGKNDPAETTGLAHYFEHLMFKGTKQFGTMDYEKEKPMLDEIEALFEVYRTKTDEAERQAIYHQIDSVSYEASKLFIPNEYDKLMTAIGATGTNAYTGYDMTVYTEDIPSNQVENWAKIQADRFENVVIRGFHTELETVYEEKNRSLTSDSRKVYERLLTSLFPHHPYGQQTVLGTQENLKNPSITNIKHFYDIYYVPNNMAICLSGDFDPDRMIKVIRKYFGHLKASDNIPQLSYEPETPAAEPIVSEVYGLEAENVTIGWRFPGLSSSEYDMLSLIDGIIANGKAGLFDLHLNQQQKVLGAGCGIYDMADYSAFLVQGHPKQGQTLDEVKDLMLAEIADLKAGKFDDFLLEATVNNFKLQQMQRMESNAGRADMFVSAFINGVNWKDEVARLERLNRITKEELVKFANEWLNEGYALIYKRQGVDVNEKKISKPEITPILTNRDASSQFLQDILASSVKPVEPVFVDFDKDMAQFKAQSNIPVLSVRNKENDLFRLTYHFDMGMNNCKLLNLAFDYLEYLGTSRYTAQQIQQELYKLACNWQMSASTEEANISVSGLAEKMPEVLALLEDLLTDAQVNPTAFDNMISDVIKSRRDAKLSQGQVFNRLRNYLNYGPKSPATNVLSDKELSQLRPEDLLSVVKSLKSYKHRVLYYGPLSQEELLAQIADKHVVPAVLNDYPEAEEFPLVKVDQSRVFFAPYNAKQLYMASSSNLGEPYEIGKEPLREMYNDYFGGGMNSIVFQEMREARGLAYSAGASYASLGKADKPYTMVTVIGTQTDKMKDALEAFHEILNNMPESQAAFRLAKEGMDARLRTERVTRYAILNYYLRMEDLKLDYDINKYLFEKIQDITLEDVKAFQEQTIKGRPYFYGVLGDENDVDFKVLEQYGPVTRLSLETLFGY
ncbi:MAG: insulinase family protein [Bacteroidales bacterium]|nr:insulinase family protein [Bacteroidales bacterium]